MLVSPISYRLDAKNNYKLDIKQVEVCRLRFDVVTSQLTIIQKDIQTQGLAVILASNPRNPTGQVIKCV